MLVWTFPAPGASNVKSVELPAPRGRPLFPTTPVFPGKGACNAHPSGGRSRRGRSAAGPGGHFDWDYNATRVGRTQPVAALFGDIIWEMLNTRSQQGGRAHRPKMISIFFLAATTTTSSTTTGTGCAHRPKMISIFFLAATSTTVLRLAPGRGGKW